MIVEDPIIIIIIIIKIRRLLYLPTLHLILSSQLLLQRSSCFTCRPHRQKIVPVPQPPPPPPPQPLQHLVQQQQEATRQCLNNILRITTKAYFQNLGIHPTFFTQDIEGSKSSNITPTCPHLHPHPLPIPLHLLAGWTVYHPQRHQEGKHHIH